MRERNSLLKLYEKETEAVFGPGERLFRIAVLCSFALFGATGLYLKTHNPPLQVMENKAERRRQVSFVMGEKKRTVAPAPIKRLKPVVKKQPEPQKEAPIDLTKNPVLNQKIDDAKPEPPKPEEQQVRRVYGLEKVYATGIGENGAASDAIIGKRGNTLNTDIDTLTATQKDLKGAVAPITTVTSAPNVKKTVEPEYSPEMIEARVEGLITAELLIDITGHVVEVKLLNDLGYGTKERARNAFFKWVFEPAKRGTETVSVWISYAIKFVLLDE